MGPFRVELYAPVSQMISTSSYATEYHPGSIPEIEAGLSEQHKPKGVEFWTVSVHKTQMYLTAHQDVCKSGLPVQVK